MYWKPRHDSKRKEIKADLQGRMNGFYQSIRESDVAFITTQTKNEHVMLWSTSPTQSKSRGSSLKKDVTRQPPRRRTSKIFRSYLNDSVESGKSLIFNSKDVSPKRQVGEFIPKLAMRLDRSGSIGRVSIQ